MTKEQKSKAKTKIKGEVSAKTSATKDERQKLFEIMRDSAGQEDIVLYESNALETAGDFAYGAILAHKKDSPTISIDRAPNMLRDGQPISAISIINDNMPFLLASLLGEINETAGEPLLVTHPILSIEYGKDGAVKKINGLGDNVKPSQNAKNIGQISFIQVHIHALDEEESCALITRLHQVLKQVRNSVVDWKGMLIRLDQAISVYRYGQECLSPEATSEAALFLEWLRDENFTFLGMREYVWHGDKETGELKRKDDSGLGILSDPDLRILRTGQEAVTTTPQIREFMASKEPLIVTKANIRSLVHRRAYLDYVGVKTFDSDGNIVGELRIVGLFTSTAYTWSVLRIPLLRSKVRDIHQRLQFDSVSHSGKALSNVLETYPRDELFQIDLDTLKHNATAILALGERPRLRVLPRAEKFGRFVSILVYVPRDHYDSQARVAIGAYLAKTYDGRVSAYYPDFPEGTLARVHFIIGRDGSPLPKVTQSELEANIRNLVRNYDDGLREVAFQEGVEPEIVAIAKGFSQSYRSAVTPEQALEDAQIIATLSEDNPIAVQFIATHEPTSAQLKIFHLNGPMSLSRRVPTLENMGFDVISEGTFSASARTGSQVHVHDMEITSAGGLDLQLPKNSALYESVFQSVWRGDIDNDGYNGLALGAGISADEIMILRCYGHYLQQVGTPHSQNYIARVLTRNPEIARILLRLFITRFAPAKNENRASEEQAIVQEINSALDDVPNLDDDTILRRFRKLMEATMRTNCFSPRRDDVPSYSLALKFDAKAIPFLPKPSPWHEIFVYGPEVEGVHLRFGPVARGGLRWSDREQDYRTEVLGLVKAQQVKNAVIVPVGAKGGFFPKALPKNGDRDAIFQAGRSAYMNFISSLLSVTDNLDGDDVIPPKHMVCHDGDDPYFVVAADKGTATFSDTANSISNDYGFWLDDAFASGGSVGYDHKKMGITARGAWEAVKRHFREMQRDIQNEPFSVVGVGDMSGDVFGNGMLLSKQTRLIAAFDHRDIFIDPTPDAGASFKERERLFALPRSSWKEYDEKLISKGGGIFSRAQKSIKLSKEAAQAIGLHKTSASPNEIIQAILRADVDLLWFGGIGTYIRAPGESDADVGDRANDAIRITAQEVGAKIIGEGANLGVTQLGRIAYGLSGGRCNSDAIDNSAGVNCSDVEVNIKIALAGAMRAKKLTRPARDKLLEAMTDEVSQLVLTTNYNQTLAISLTAKKGLANLPHHVQMMHDLESRGLLDRAVELLPDDKMIGERHARGEGLTRAEIGVLVSYAKIVLFQDFIDSNLPDEPHLNKELYQYFPQKMRETMATFIDNHRLRREIIATQLANDAIDRGGPSFVSRLIDLTGCEAANVGYAFAGVWDGFGLGEIYASIDALDNKISGDNQLVLYDTVGEMLHGGCFWALRNGDRSLSLAQNVKQLSDASKTLVPVIADFIPTFMGDKLQQRIAYFEGLGADSALARQLALLNLYVFIQDIDSVARQTQTKLVDAAKLYFAVTQSFVIARIEEAARSIAHSDYYDGLAFTRAETIINSARRAITMSVINDHGKEKDPLQCWINAHQERIDQTRGRINAILDSGELTISRLSVAAGLMHDLGAAS